MKAEDKPATLSAEYPKNGAEPWRVALAEARKRSVTAAATYRKRNPAYRVTSYIRRMQPQRIPAWVDMEAVNAIYAAALAQGLVVDHIIPMRSDKVSGLHVHYNLQLLTKSENSRKSNKFDPDIHHKQLTEIAKWKP